MKKSLHRQWWFAYCLALWFVCSAAGGENLLPNPDFERGLAGWEVAPRKANVAVTPVRLAAHPHAALITADCESREAGLNSEPFRISAEQRYMVAGWVKGDSMDGRYKLACEWLDKRGAHIRYGGGWTGRLVGDWERAFAVATPPPDAYSARVLIGVQRGCSAMMTGLVFAPVPPDVNALFPRLTIDLFCQQIRDPSKPWHLRVRLENLGLATLHGLRGRVDLPEGVTGAAEFTIDVLPREAVRNVVFTLRGTPSSENESLCCTVKAIEKGREATFSARARPFISYSAPHPAAAGDLPAPAPCPTRVTFGCYYFPVMLDWSRKGWGVRPVPYLEPLLGYYDEARSETADWHIKWAVEHGVRLFVFDWYYNQGFTYLNDALERGFLNSRFADRMQFCLDWCNEGQCTEFKPLDFSDESLAGMLRYMEARYFRHPNYLRVEGKPALFIHQPWRLAAAHGGWKGCARALDKLRALARRLGEPGLYLVAVHNSPFPPPYSDGGFECLCRP